MNDDQARAITTLLQTIAKQQVTLIKGMDTLNNKLVDLDKKLDEPIPLIGFEEDPVEVTPKND